MSIDDAGAVEVVGRDLDADPVAGEDADPEPSHLPGHVAEHFVAVVELHPEHGVRERLDHLALELDLLFLRQDGRFIPPPGEFPYSPSPVSGASCGGDSYCSGSNSVPPEGSPVLGGAGVSGAGVAGSGVVSLSPLP